MSMETRTEKYKSQRALIDLENTIENLKEDNFQNETYIETLHICGKDIEVWLDDYGQCYFLKWKNDSGETQEESCGTYNPDYEEYAKVKFDKDYKYELFRKQGLILASDREYMCRQIAKMIASKELPIEMYDKYLYGMPFVGRDEEDTFKMIYGTWCKND